MQTSVLMMDVAEGAIETYTRLHDEMPDAVRATLRQHGILDMHIYLADRRVLVCATSVDDISACLARLSADATYAAWASQFADVLPSPAPNFALPIWRL